MVYRNTKNLVSDAASHHDAMEPRKSRRELLRKGSTHQHIAQVYHQTHSNQFYISSIHSHQGIYTIFTCRRAREEAADKTNQSCQPRLLCNDAQWKRHSKISHRDRNPIANTRKNIVPQTIFHSSFSNSSAKVQKNNENQKRKRKNNFKFLTFNYQRY